MKTLITMTTNAAIPMADRKGRHGVDLVIVVEDDKPLDLALPRALDTLKRELDRIEGRTTTDGEK